MAIVGRKSIPTALKVLRGNPGRHPLNRNEPQPALGVPECPVWLDADGKACWSETTRELEAMGLLTLADAGALAELCRTWSRWRAAERMIDAEGNVTRITERSGDVIVRAHPAVREAA